MLKFFSNTRKILGFFAIVISIFSFLSLYNVTMKIAQPAHNLCVAANPNIDCTILGHIPYESYLGLGALVFLGLSGAYMVLSEETRIKTATKLAKSVKEALKSLTAEEKSVYERIKSSDGFIFQNDLIQKTGFSKVKVSRLLDKLEAKNLVERRRRGMSNVVVLKHLGW